MNVVDIIGPHPAPPHLCGVSFSASEGQTQNNVPHRVLRELPVQPAAFIEGMTEWIVNHHVSGANIDRDRKRREALARQGLVDPTGRFPTNTKTQKGNWAEVLLAEYITACSGAHLPVYRLRYNPNIDQSMKGDDVLAFDLNGSPVKILVGEAKFRSTPSKKAVEELVNALTKSHSGSIPASLQFVADCLYESGNEAEGGKVAECNALFAQGRLQLNYVGLLVSNSGAHVHANRHARSHIPRLAVLSLEIANPDVVVSQCYANVVTRL